MMEKDLVVIGGGPAGLAAALSAKTTGVKDILLIERGKRLGGILNQCIHDGFGIELFGEALTGPEYAHKYIEEFNSEGIEVLLEATVTDLSADRKLTVISPKGLIEIQAKAVILATGCRERTREMIRIPGERPAGVYTAGCAQNMINLLGYMPGKKVVILGSGDIGLIMARRLTLEGAKVLAVVEIMPYSSGLRRNVVQCLNDYDIPLHLNHTVVTIKGRKRLESVTIARVDERMQPIKGTEKEFECDTLLLSVGLIPENELAEKAGIELDLTTKGPKVNELNETSVPGIYSAGNALQVHDLVDWVTLEAETAGKHAAKYLKDDLWGGRSHAISACEKVQQVLPHYYLGEKDFVLSLRVSIPLKNKTIVVRDGHKIVKKSFQVGLNPAEMIRIELSKKDVENTRGLAVDVE